MRGVDRLQRRGAGGPVGNGAFLGEQGGLDRGAMRRVAAAETTPSDTPSAVRLCCVPVWRA